MTMKRITATGRRDLRVDVASARARAAIQHVQRALDETKTACRALSELKGAVPEHRALSRVSETLHDLRREIDAHVHSRDYTLGRDPDGPELAEALGHGADDEGVSHVGCGRHP